MLKLAIFDMDQTLVDTLPRFHIIFNRTLNHFGCKEVEWDEFVKKYKEDTLNDYVCVDHKTFWDYFLLHYNDIICEKDRVIPGAVEVMKHLKERGVKIAIITGRMVPPEEVWKELKRFSLDKYVDLVYTRLNNYCDGRRRTELILEAMQKLKSGKDETFFVGDYWPDMQSGREAGIYTIGVLTGHEDRDKLMENGANAVIESVSSLLPLLREKNIIS